MKTTIEQTQEIDYQTEVKKIYPKAYIHCEVVFNREVSYEIRIPHLFFFYKRLSFPTFRRDQVWKRAYEKIQTHKKP